MVILDFIARLTAIVIGVLSVYGLFLILKGGNHEL